MATTHADTVGQLVDTARYPLLEPGGDGWHAVVARVQRELQATGCSVLPAFVAPALRDTLRREGEEIAVLAYHGVETVNVYNTAADPTLPERHPARVTMERGNAFVGRDAIPDTFVIHQLYASTPFRRFVAACVGRAEIHELADPLSALCLNVVAPGRSHPWHFDTNEFTVSMLTRAPQAGGTFEWCPDIRTAGAENFEDVQAVLDGDGEHLVRRLALQPGDLQLFAGRYSLHRVTAVEGATARHSAIFAYSERPGVVGSVARTRQLFGRLTPAHGAAALRTDELLD